MPVALPGPSEGAVTHARVAKQSQPGDFRLYLDRRGGVMETTSECRVLINALKPTHDYKTVTPNMVTNDRIDFTTPMEYGHLPGELVLIKAPHEGVKLSEIGAMTSDPILNVATFNRFCQHGGLADLAGGSGIIFDGGLSQNGMAKVKGSKVFLKSYGLIAGDGFSQHASMTFPSDGSVCLVSIQDDAGNTPTPANPVSNGAPLLAENLVCYGNLLVEQGTSDSAGLMWISEGGQLNGLRYRNFRNGIYWGGRGGHMNNIQPDYCLFNINCFGDGWVLENINATAGQATGLSAGVRVTGGRGGTILGGDLETRKTPGVIINLLGDCTGFKWIAGWTSGIEGAVPAVVFNVESIGPDAQGCAYELIGCYCNQQDPLLKLIRDAPRGFSISAANNSIYNRIMTAKTVSATQVRYSAPSGDAIAGLVNGSYVPQIAGTLP